MRTLASAVFRSPAFPPLCLAGVLLAGLLIGIEPVGGDPDRLYRPIKAELARALAEGRLPFWTIHLGLGFPLVAESHAAAFYPPNWLLYRFLSVPAAYRLSMFLHYLLLVAATFAYARRLEIGPTGAAVAALSFGFCGFQSIHSSHEVFYHALAYLPLCLYLAEWFLAEGRGRGLVLLAIVYALQLSVGHFQIQSWTAGLVLLTGVWRLAGSPRLVGRVFGLLAALVWGGAIAAVQLGASWELARFVGFDRRSFADLAFFGFPPAHWVELFAPTLFRGIPGGPEASYWYSQGTTGYEACFYVGTIPLILAVIGLCSGRGRGRGRSFWVATSLASFIVAILPVLWLQGFAWVVTIPGMGLFRAPGRFLAIASLGLCLAAGRGLDSASGGGRTWPGLVLSWLFAAVAAWWGLSWCLRPDHASILGGDRLLLSLALTAASWVVATILIAATVRRRIGPGVLLAATALELGGLYYTSTTDWGWAIAVPEQSPVLARLAEERDVGRVAGLLHDLPLRFAATPAYPHTGFAPPPPHPLLEQLEQRAAAGTPWGRGLLRRFGVTHGVWDGPVDDDGIETIHTGPDATLDRLVYKPPGAPPHANWRLVRYKDVMPQVRAATRARFAPDEPALIAGISYDLDPSVVWYLAKDRRKDPEPGATAARVVAWNGREATVEHDGPCDLVVNRTYYPGWSASIDDGPQRPVGRAELGVQVVHLPNAGTHRVRFSYRPTTLWPASWISAGALVLAMGGLAVEARRFVARGAS
ncbi:YfhO family protein [Paludisphaera borealis]|uniref:YfhO family protein n=1 Tax=Paludisphaera borealis TaxID=1387353 RepID=A0A1U7CMY5_9BACT|nr:YfhO family protein [Paludisphaera borealis]APW60287.1 hypothetical protein BSF38_01755 [Paludisphaera borealis]